MDLIPGIVLFLGAIVTVGILGFDNFQNRNQPEITKPRLSNPTNQQKKRRGLFNRG